jgi:c-di-GMP-binding flagellar brake protein YcgR
MDMKPPGGRDRRGALRQIPIPMPVTALHNRAGSVRLGRTRGLLARIASRGETMSSNPAVPQFSELSLKSLKLRAGMFLQTQRLEKNSPNYEAQFLGVIDEKCLMVVPVGTFSIKTGMKAGETFIIRGFTGQYDFHFVSKVIQAFDFTFREPAYAYAVLTFPESVQARKVRNSIRIKTSLAATASPHGGSPPVAATIVDLSVEGALLHTPEPLGATGDLVGLAFSMDDGADLAYLDTLARICHGSPSATDGGRLTGLLFENISAKDRLTIKEYVLSNVE